MRFNNGFKMNTSRKQFKMKKEKGERRFPLKWWHILLIVLGVLLIAAGITVAVIVGKINNMISDAGAGGDGGENIEITGTITSAGTFLPRGSEAYVLCEYTELISGEKASFVKSASSVPYERKSHYVLVSQDGTLDYKYSGEFSGNYTPEEIKAQLLALVQSKFGYTNEEISRFDVKVFEPVSFTEVKISEVTVADGNATVKYQAGAVGEELSEEYTLSGTYAQTGNDFAFTYTNLPEDAHLLCVAEKVLASAKYEYYAQYGAWVNTLTFADSYTLFLQVEE